MPAILALVISLAPLIPKFSEQISGWVTIFRQNGSLTDEQQAQVHALAEQIHAEVVAMAEARIAEG